MSSGPMKDYEEILVALRQLMRAADIHSQKLVREVGLTTPQLLVMQAIEKEGNPSTSALARHIVVSQATVTRIVDRLEHAGLVRRKKSSKDKRVVNVCLTQIGREKLEAAPEPLQSEFLNRFRTLDGWEQHMLKAALLRIATMMDAENIDAAPILQTGDIVEPPTKG